LLVLFIYMYSVICAAVIGSDASYPFYTDDSDQIANLALEGFNNWQYFGTVGRSFLTLFSLLTLSEWSMVTRPLIEHQPFGMFVITVFILVAVFGMLNIVVGVLVERALMAAQKFSEQGREVELARRMLLVEEFEALLKEMDVDGSGHLTKDEFIKAVNETPNFRHLLQKLDFPTGFTVGEMFTLMDNSGDGTIDVLEFKNAMARLMECSPFQQLCLLLKSLNDTKSLTRTVAHEKPTEMHPTKNLSDFSESKDREKFFPGCFKEDLAVLRLELQEMKAELSSKINNLFWVSCPSETRSHRLLVADDQIPHWTPLPTDGEQFDSSAGTRCAPVGDDPPECRNDAKQPWLATASTRWTKECTTNYSAEGTIHERRLPSMQVTK